MNGSDGYSYAGGGEVDMFTLIKDVSALEVDSLYSGKISFTGSRSKTYTESSSSTS
jgi:hypothetical protein